MTNQRKEADLTAAHEAVRTLLQDKRDLEEVLQRTRKERTASLEEIKQLRTRVETLERQATTSPAAEPASAGGMGDEDEFDELDVDELDEDDHYEDAIGFVDSAEDTRARRSELDRERTDRELESSTEDFWMKCPKCGEMLEEYEEENVKMERCENCGGIYLDRGESDLLTGMLAQAGGVDRIRNFFRF